MTKLLLALALTLSSAAGSARTAVAPSIQAAQADIALWQAGQTQRPVWIDGGRIRPEAQQLLNLVRSAAIDGLDPDAYRVRIIESTLRSANGGNPRDLVRADALLSETLVAFARDMHLVRSGEMKFVDPAAIPPPPAADQLLIAAARAPSLSAWLDEMPWMNPTYAALRRNLSNDADPRHLQLLRINLERARALPGALQGGRYVIVDAAGARLSMFEDGAAIGSMRVVVGRTDNPTPMIAGMIRYAILNPYWNVPPDLAATRLAPHVVTDGLEYLKTARYQVLSDWSDKAKPVDPRTIDWPAAAAGRLPDLRMRQLPGPNNSMGQIKFMFPNSLGIYLHDTDNKSLFAEPARQKSGGCIRLEDAARLSRWLYGKPLKTTSKLPERTVALPVPVPVYVTYLTAAPENGQIAYRDDFYDRDHLPALRQATR